MIQKLGHILIIYKSRQVCYSEFELRRLHLHLMHPAVDRLFSMVKQARPGEAGGDLRTTIKSITYACETCRNLTKRPSRIRESMHPDRVVFNLELSMDLMWLNVKPILRIVDRHTQFKNGVPFRTKRAEDVWYAFVEGLASIYLGDPNILRMDQEATFTSEFFRDTAGAHGIELLF